MTVAATTDTTELLTLAIGPACHELRSPLAVVYGFARMLEDAGSDAGDAAERYSPQIVRGAERLDALLDDFAQLGRIAAGRSRPHLERASLKEIIGRVAQDSVNEHRLSVDAGTDVAVHVDAEWLTKVIQAVIEGLCFEEGIDVQVSWRIEKHEAMLQLVPNSSFPMVDVEPEKSGLGISLARMRVVAMGGAFDGRGDRVVITLPRT